MRKEEYKDIFTNNEYLKKKYGDILNEFYHNNGEKLYKFVDMIVNKKFGGTTNNDMPEFYSEAGDVFCDIIGNDRYISEKGSFDGFLYKSLVLSFIDMDKKQKRNKRKNKIEVEIDGEKKKIPVEDIRLDAPIDNDKDTTFGDVIQAGSNIQDNSKEKVDVFLDNLSLIQRKIVVMKINGFTTSQIKSQLNLSLKEYEDNLKGIKENRMIVLFNKGYKERKSNKWRMEKMNTKIEYDMNEIMDLDTTDGYRRDNRTLKSLLEDIQSGEIDRYYISQRAALIWEDEQINKFYSRVLNNQPIPEIVVCETMECGEKVSYLVEGLQRLSYAEEFKENRIPVKMKGAEFVNIRYKKYEYDANGRKILDENGRAKYTLDVFNIIGKFYKDLPEFLQRRFDNYNMLVTRYFNCTHKMIDYHIRNYNNHVAMTKSQYGITNVSNATSRNIKNISNQHPFFKNSVKCTTKNRKKGALDEFVVRTIMLMNFLDSWKKELIDALKFIDKNATDEQFKHLKENLDRLFKVSDKSVQDLFNTTNGYIWLTVFDKFLEFDINDEKFIDFMRAFKETLHSKVVNGRSYDMVNKRNTKDKSIVIGKLEMIIDLMYDYFGIEQKNETENILEFVKSNVNPDITVDDIEQYEEVLDELTLNVDNSSKLMDKHNRPSLVAITAYSFENDIDLDEWIVHYFKKQNTYIRNQKENFIHMKNNLMNYIKKGKVA